MASTSTQPQSDPEKDSRERISIMIAAYDDVLAANKILKAKYRAREEAMRKTLQEVQHRLLDIKKSREAEFNARRDRKSKKPVAFYYSSVGIPYFKDKDQNPPPDNVDMVIMKQFNMYDNSHAMAVTGWTLGDKTRLLAVLLDMTKEIIQKQLKSKIAYLQRIKAKTSTIATKIAQLKKEIVVLKHKTLENLDIQVDQDFDWEEVAVKLNMRHSPNEYRAIWELFFHPRVNKKAWTPVEHMELQRLAAEKNMQDWESIAKSLNTGRTAYQCFVYFRTIVSHPANGGKWTQQEMEYLRRVIDLYREDNYIPWGKVAASIKSRTKIQCYNKYMRMIESRKGRFIPEEDAVILNFVNRYGTDFRKMSSFLTGRSAVQLRVRYKLLMKMRLSTTWSVEDDKKLLQIMANLDGPANFSIATKHFPGKDRQNIRSRYNTLVKWIQSHPHSDVATAPRRGARRLAHGEPTSNLVKALQAFRSKINGPLHKPLEDKKPQKLSRESSDTFLHDSIMSTISAIEMRKSVMKRRKKVKVRGSFKMLQVQDISSTPREQSDLFNIRHILILLNAQLADRKKFFNSEVGKGFERIEKMIPKVDETGLVKTYSKKNLTVIEVDENPSIFGPITGQGEYLLPPNFATVTGSRVILNQLNKCYGSDTNDKCEIDINHLARRNLHVHEKLKQLKERFSILFTWPYILSNESPKTSIKNAEQMKSSSQSDTSDGTVSPPLKRKKKGKHRGMPDT